MPHYSRISVAVLDEAQRRGRSGLTRKPDFIKEMESFFGRYPERVKLVFSRTSPCYRVYCLKTLGTNEILVMGEYSTDNIEYAEVAMNACLREWLTGLSAVQTDIEAYMDRRVV